MRAEICVCLAFCFQCQTLTRGEQLLSPVAATPAGDLIWAGSGPAAGREPATVCLCWVGTLYTDFVYTCRLSIILSICAYTHIWVWELWQCKRLSFLDCFCGFLVLLRHMGMTNNSNTCWAFICQYSVTVRCQGQFSVFVLFCFEACDSPMIAFIFLFRSLPTRCPDAPIKFRRVIFLRNSTRQCGPHPTCVWSWAEPALRFFWA